MKRFWLISSRHSACESYIQGGGTMLEWRPGIQFCRVCLPPRASVRRRDSSMALSKYPAKPQKSEGRSPDDAKAAESPRYHATCNDYRQAALLFGR